MFEAQLSLASPARRGLLAWLSVITSEVTRCH